MRRDARPSVARSPSMNRRTFLMRAAAGVAAARLGSAGGASATSAGPLVLVTADTEGHVAVVNAATGRILRRLGTADGPRSIERVAGAAIVAHTELGRITLIDTQTFERQRILSRFAEPRYTAAHPDGRHALISDSGLGEVIVLDVARRRVVARVSVGGKARHLTIDPTGRRLWTALGTTAERIAIVDVSDPTTPRLIQTITAPFLAHDVVFAPTDDRVWVTSGDRGALAIYDSSTQLVVRRLAALAPPQHLTFSERGRVAFVTSGDDASLRVHDLDGRLLRAAHVPEGSYNVSRGNGHVFTPSLDRGTLCMLDRNGSVRRTVRVAAAAHDACAV